MRPWQGAYPLEGYTACPPAVFHTLHVRTTRLAATTNVALLLLVLLLVLLPPWFVTTPYNHQLLTLTLAGDECWAATYSITALLRRFISCPPCILGTSHAFIFHCSGTSRYGFQVRSRGCHEPRDGQSGPLVLKAMGPSEIDRKPSIAVILDIPSARGLP